MVIGESLEGSLDNTRTVEQLRQLAMLGRLCLAASLHVKVGEVKCYACAALKVASDET